MKSNPMLHQLSTASLKAKMSRYFEAHGKFCASHPWEVIVTTVTLTVCILSMSFLNGGKIGSVCGFSSFNCPKKSLEEENADTFLMIIVNSLAILYLYNQFSSLRKAGSKYLLGIATLFTIFASFVFGSSVVNFIDSKATGLNEALPFFLLLIDLSKATSLAQFASGSTNRGEIRLTIGNGMAILGPTLSLDTLVEVLIISIGTISGVRQLEIVCYFGCLSLLANYLVFMTFFPASLALILEVCPHNPSNATWHIDRLARGMTQEEDKKKPNPVVQRVKIIMALGLVVVHIHSRFLSRVTGMSLSLSSSSTNSPALLETTGNDQGYEQVPLQEYIWWKTLNPSIDQLVTVGLAILLLLKYIFYDKPVSNSMSNDKPVSSITPKASAESPFNDKDITAAYFRKRRISINSVPAVTNYYEQNDKKVEMTCRKDSGIELSSPVDVNQILQDNFQSGQSGSNSWKKVTSSVAVQTELTDMKPKAKFSISLFDIDESDDIEDKLVEPPIIAPPRSLEECLKIFKGEDGPSLLTDEEVISLVKAKHIPAYKLESVLGDPERGVVVRRKLISSDLSNTEALESLPYSGYDYRQIIGACCENVIGYMPIPVGVAGPLLLDGCQYYVPMSTTEGCLIASTNRGCRAITAGGGVTSQIVGDGMTRGPVIRMPCASKASSLKLWLDDPSHFPELAEVFNSTSRYAKLKSVHTAVAGRLIYVRFRADTGDAMGMNMLSKGVENSLKFLQKQFPELEVISLSGNYCTDKKPSAINWIEGRGKYVVCDATIPARVVENVLKTSVDALIDVNTNKNLVGSAMAGSIGGFNAHAANIVTAIFIATGQDPAQVVGSSNCITLMERGGPFNEDLYISCTMPSLEVGTVGGGTFLHAQSACLEILGVHGPSLKGQPGDNAGLFARIICGTVLSGELSLISALAAGHLVKSHLTLNRSHLTLSTMEDNKK